MISLRSGRGGLPFLALGTSDGATADIYLHGAHITSWRPAGGEEALFLSDRAVFAAGEAIRGGVPVVFPQFSDRGPLPKHGFARTLTWEWVNEDEAHTAERAVLRLTDSPATRALWPQEFTLELTVTPRESALTIEISVENRGTAELSFSTALHTYLRIDEIAAVTVTGLEGTHYRSKPEGVEDEVDQAAQLEIRGEIDRVYRNAPREITVTDPAAARTIRVASEGFQDAVVWNPGARLAAAMADMDDEEYRAMLCVEAAQVESPVTLAPGASWRAAQLLRCTPIAP